MSVCKKAPGAGGSKALNTRREPGPPRSWQALPPSQGMLLAEPGGVLEATTSCKKEFSETKTSSDVKLS